MNFSGQSKEEREAEAKFAAGKKAAEDRAKAAERLRAEAEARLGTSETERLRIARELANERRVTKNAVKTSARLVSRKGRDGGRSHHKKKAATSE